MISYNDALAQRVLMPTLVNDFSLYVWQQRITTSLLNLFCALWEYQISSLSPSQSPTIINHSVKAHTMVHRAKDTNKAKPTESSNKNLKTDARDGDSSPQELSTTNSSSPSSKKRRASKDSTNDSYSPPPKAPRRSTPRGSQSPTPMRSPHSSRF